VYLATGLKTYNYQTYLPGHADARGTTYRPFARPMPPRCIAMLYNDRESFAVTPKPGQWRAVAVTRDPRDLLVSWFFAFKFSHQLQGDTPRLRRILTQTDEEDGLLFGIQHLEEVGIFNALRSWSVEELFGGRVMVVPYERLTGPEQGNSVRRLFRHLEIPMGEAQVRQLLTDHSFRARTGGRAQGREDVHAHYRKGTPGDWESHFTGQVLDTFKAATGDLVEVMGYSWDHPQFPPSGAGSRTLPRRSENDDPY